MTELPHLPDGLWAVLSTLAQPGRPALSYQEIASVTDISVPTVGKHLTTIVDHGWASLDRHGRFHRATVTDAGVEASAVRATLPTVQAVIAEARRICREEHAFEQAHPYEYTKPYIPTDATARKLSQQHGPEVAIAMLKHTQRERRARYAEETVEGERRDQRHERRQAQMARDLQARRRGLTAGQRLDEVLLQLSKIQSAPAARIDADPVTDGGGGKDDANPVPRLYDDTVGWAQGRVDSLIAQLERTLAEQQRRLCDFERQAVA